MHRKNNTDKNRRRANRRKQKLSNQLRARVKSIATRLRSFFKTKKDIKGFNARVEIGRAYKRLFRGILGAKTWKDLRKMGFEKVAIQY